MYFRIFLISQTDDDNEFLANEQDYEEDYVDSDFDIDENDDEQTEIEVDEETEEKRRQRALKRRGIITKAYKVIIYF